MSASLWQRAQAKRKRPSFSPTLRRGFIASAQLAEGNEFNLTNAKSGLIALKRRSPRRVRFATDCCGICALQVRQKGSPSSEQCQRVAVSRDKNAMIHHLSIAARNPQHVAEVLAEFMGGAATRFTPNPGSWFAHQHDEHGTGVEVYPAGTALRRAGPGG